MADEKIMRELQHLEKRGLLKPEDIVDFAKNPKTALHEKFIWDNTEAAHLWRLHQARNLIRVLVTIDPDSGRETKVYVSLTPDRNEDGGGYRRVEKVLTDAEQRAQMLQDAHDEWMVFKEKYQELKELVQGIEEMDKAFSKKKSPQRKAEIAATA